jgi:HEAT repeat protein
MPLYPELNGRSLEALLQGFDSGPTPADAIDGEEIPLWLGEVAVTVAKKGEAGLTALLQRLPTADEDHTRAILLALPFVPADVREKNRPRLQALLLSYLADDRPWVVADAIDTLRHLESREASDHIRSLLDRGEPPVVSSALRFLAWYDPNEAKPVLLRGLESPEPLVRENAVDELDELECVEALPQLRRLLADEDQDVRQAAQTAVNNLEDVQAQRGR